LECVELVGWWREPVAKRGREDIAAADIAGADIRTKNGVRGSPSKHAHALLLTCRSPLLRRFSFSEYSIKMGADLFHVALIRPLFRGVMFLRQVVRSKILPVYISSIDEARLYGDRRLHISVPVQSK
jgi:hypothetical protein